MPRTKIFTPTFFASYTQEPGVRFRQLDVPYTLKLNLPALPDIDLIVQQCTLPGKLVMSCEGGTRYAVKVIAERGFEIKEILSRLSNGIATILSAADTLEKDPTAEFEDAKPVSTTARPTGIKVKMLSVKDMLDPSKFAEAIASVMSSDDDVADSHVGAGSAAAASGEGHGEGVGASDDTDSDSEDEGAALAIGGFAEILTVDAFAEYVLAQAGLVSHEADITPAADAHHAVTNTYVNTATMLPVDAELAGHMDVL